jgi:hypothetical protein
MKLPEVNSRHGAPMGRGWPHIGDCAETVVAMYEQTPPVNDVERRHFAVAKAYLNPPAGTIDISVTRCNIDSGGYDSGGAYWGTGDPLYYVASDNGTIDLYLRCKSSRAAKAEVISRFPNARIV